MAGVHSQVYIQFVFVVKGRSNLLKRQWRDEVFKYISAIIKAKNQKAIIVNGVEDHVHVFFGQTPSMRLSDLARDLKNNSSKFINDKKFLPCKFAWQEGYGVFSYSHSHIKNVYNYIKNQEEHHKKKTFKEEYFEFLQKFEVNYDERYLFEWLE